MSESEKQCWFKAAEDLLKNAFMAEGGEKKHKKNPTPKSWWKSEVSVGASIASFEICYSLMSYRRKVWQKYPYRKLLAWLYSRLTAAQVGIWGQNPLSARLVLVWAHAPAKPCCCLLGTSQKKWWGFGGPPCPRPRGGCVCVLKGWHLINWGEIVVAFYNPIRFPLVPGLLELLWGLCLFQDQGIQFLQAVL